MSTDKIDYPNVLVQPAGFTEPIRFSHLIMQIVNGKTGLSPIAAVLALEAQRPGTIYGAGVDPFVKAIRLSAGAGSGGPTSYLRAVNKWHRDVKRVRFSPHHAVPTFCTLQDFVGEEVARFILYRMDAEQEAAQLDIPFSDRPWWLHIDGERRCYKSLKSLLQAHADLPAKPFHTFSHAKHPKEQELGAKASSMTQGVYWSLNDFLRDAVMRGWVR